MPAAGPSQDRHLRSEGGLGGVEEGAVELEWTGQAGQLDRGATWQAPGIGACCRPGRFLHMTCKGLRREPGTARQQGDGVLYDRCQEDSGGRSLPWRRPTHISPQKAGK